MAELSTKRSNFYKQIYFPSTYYKEVFDLTLEEAKDTQKAQAELQKLLIDADTNLARLSETFRERALSPSQQLQVQADEELLAAEAKGAERGAAATRAFAANPARGATNSIEIALASAKGDAPTLPEAERRKIVASEAKRAMANQPPAIQRRIANDLASKYGKTAELLAAVQETLGTPGLTFGGIAEQVASKEDTAVIEATKKSGVVAGPKTPAGEAAQARLDAMASPFANASTEQTNRVAAGIDDTEDELLRLYLGRLQDKDSPGEVTEAEIAADPRLAEAEAVYEKVRAENSYQKSAAEWYSAEYLSSLKTKSNLEKKAATDPFDGLDPYRWAQREALKRGGYTKESLLHLQALTTRPELAPYVNPAFTRLRAEGGLDPKSAAEATIKAAFEANPKLTIAELDAILEKKRADLTKQGRQDARAVMKEARGELTVSGKEMVTLSPAEELAGVSKGEKARMLAKRERKGARETANELYASPEAADEAKAYLLALRLNKAGTPAAPDTGTKIEVPVTEADTTTTAKDAAGADVNRAAAAAKATAQQTSTDAAEREAARADLRARAQEQRAVLDQRARDRASTELEGDLLSGSKGAVLEPTPDEIDTTLQDRIKTLPPAAQDLLRAASGQPPLTPAPKAPAPRPKAPTAAPKPAAAVPPVKPAPAPKAAPAAPTAPPAAPPPAPPPVNEAQQLRGLLKSKVIVPGTPQYDAALLRLDELEGVQ